MITPINQQLEPSSYKPLKIDKEELINLSLIEKLKYIDGIIIQTTKVQSVFKKIEECHNSTKYLSKPQCMTIIGQSGIGKTTFSETYLKRYPEKVLTEYTQKPVFYSIIPCPAYIGSLPNSMLQNLGDPFCSKGRNIFTQTQRLYNFLKVCKVEIIIIDEVQHLVDRNSQKLIRDSSDWFKELIDEVRIPIIFMGMPDSKRIFIENEQLGTRVRYQEELLPFEYNISFRQFLHVYDKQLPFKNLSNLGSMELSKKIHTATNGIMRNIKDLILEASNISLQLNLNRISLSALSEAFDRVLLNTGENVFKK